MENQRDEETRLEIEYLAKKYKCDFKKQAHDKEIDIYKDQLNFNVKSSNLSVSSFYTSHGIKIFDTWYCKQIRDGYKKYSKKQFKNLIINNPHLHNIIKTNLLENLNNLKK